MALYDVTDEDVSLLDELESADTGLYRKTMVGVHDAGRAGRLGLRPRRVRGRAAPRPGYLGVLADAAKPRTDRLRPRAAHARVPVRRDLTQLLRRVTNETTPRELADQAAQRLREATGVERHDVALVMGSGWLPAVGGAPGGDRRVEHPDLPASRRPPSRPRGQDPLGPRRGPEPPGLPRPYPLLRGARCRSVVHGVRTAAAAGCRVAVLTNGCGGLEESGSRVRRC